MVNIKWQNKYILEWGSNRFADRKMDDLCCFRYRYCAALCYIGISGHTDIAHVSHALQMQFYWFFVCLLHCGRSSICILHIACTAARWRWRKRRCISSLCTVQWMLASSFCRREPYYLSFMFFFPFVFGFFLLKTMLNEWMVDGAGIHFLSSRRENSTHDEDDGDDDDEAKKCNVRLLLLLLALNCATLESVCAKYLSHWKPFISMPIYFACISPPFTQNMNSLGAATAQNYFVNRRIVFNWPTNYHIEKQKFKCDRPHANYDSSSSSSPSSSTSSVTHFPFKYASFFVRILYCIHRFVSHQSSASPQSDSFRFGKNIAGYAIVQDSLVSHDREKLTVGRLRIFHTMAIKSRRNKSNTHGVQGRKCWFHEMRKKNATETETQNWWHLIVGSKAAFLIFMDATCASVLLFFLFEFQFNIFDDEKIPNTQMESKLNEKKKQTANIECVCVRVSSIDDIFNFLQALRVPPFAIFSCVVHFYFSLDNHR